MSTLFGHRGLSVDFSPVVRLAFYGQKHDESFFREDSYIYPQTPVEKVEQILKRKEEKIDPLWISYGIDSRIYGVDDTISTSYVGNVLFVDIDKKELSNKDLKTVKVIAKKFGEADIVSTKNGFHLYVWDVFKWSDIRDFLTTKRAKYLLCDKFIRSTLYLRGSVLRLYPRKKGQPSSLHRIQDGVVYNDFLDELVSFVRKHQISPEEKVYEKQQHGSNDKASKVGR